MNSPSIGMSPELNKKQKASPNLEEKGRKLWDIIQEEEMWSLPLLLGMSFNIDPFS